jgi:hypothetical protein
MEQAREALTREKPEYLADWPEYWAARLCAAACREGFREKQEQWADLLREYLRKNPYVPSRVYVARMISFLESVPQSERLEAARCLYFFYERVHPSEEHRDASEKVGRKYVENEAGTCQPTLPAS